MEQDSKGLLDDLHEQYTLVPATQWQRLKNFLLDAFFSFSFFTAIMLPSINLLPNLFTNALGFFLMTTLPFFLYYFLLEAFNKGRTIGKMITGTQAVEKDGMAVNMQSAMLRSIIRFIPFEALSGLGKDCWHDKWTNTVVVQKNI